MEINHSKLFIKWTVDLWARRPMTAIMISAATYDVKNLIPLYYAMIGQFNYNRLLEFQNECREDVYFHINRDFKEENTELARIGEEASSNLKEAITLHFNTLNNNKIQSLILILPWDIKDSLISLYGNNIDSLVNIKMEIGELLELYFYNTKWAVLVEGLIVREEHINYVASQLISGSGMRAGIEGTLHHIQTIQNAQAKVIGLNLRVGRTVFGMVSIIDDILARGQSFLLVGTSLSGKTTLIRDICRVIAENKRVVVIDTFNEVAGYGDIAHESIGKAIRIKVDGRKQYEVMLEAVQKHSPEVLVVDKILTKLEVLTLEYLTKKGITLCVSVDCDFKSIGKNQILSALLGEIENVRFNNNEETESPGEMAHPKFKNKSIFTNIVELPAIGHSEWKIYYNIQKMAEKMLSGEEYGREVRIFDRLDNTIHKRFDTVKPSEQTSESY